MCENGHIIMFIKGLGWQSEKKLQEGTNLYGVLNNNNYYLYQILSTFLRTYCHYSNYYILAITYHLTTYISFYT